MYLKENLHYEWDSCGRAQRKISNTIDLRSNTIQSIEEFKLQPYVTSNNKYHLDGSITIDMFQRNRKGEINFRIRGECTIIPKHKFEQECYENLVFHYMNQSDLAGEDSRVFDNDEDILEYALELGLSEDLISQARQEAHHNLELA